jgi:hypothetical protein
MTAQKGTRKIKHVTVTREHTAETGQEIMKMGRIKKKGGRTRMFESNRQNGGQ